MAGPRPEASCISDAGHSLLDVETAEPTLEDVFLRVTGTGDGDRREAPMGGEDASGTDGDAKGADGDAGDSDGTANDDPESAMTRTEVVADGDS